LLLVKAAGPNPNLDTGLTQLPPQAPTAHHLVPLEGADDEDVAGRPYVADTTEFSQEASSPT